MTTSSPSFPGIWSLYGEACILLKKYWKSFAIIILLYAVLTLLSAYITKPQLFFEKYIELTQGGRTPLPEEILNLYKSFLYKALPFFPFSIALVITFCFQTVRIVAIEKTGRSLRYFERFWSWFGAVILSSLATVVTFLLVFVTIALVGGLFSLIHNKPLVYLLLFITLIGIIVLFIFSSLLFSSAHFLSLVKKLGAFAACKNSPKIITSQWKLAIWKLFLFSLVMLVLSFAMQLMGLPFLMEFRSSLGNNFTTFTKESIAVFFSVKNIIFMILYFLIRGFITLVGMIAANIFTFALIDRAEKLGVKIQ